MAEFNPYQSPTGTSPQGDKPDPYEPVTLAELQARVVELERQIKASWFMGPLWKRSFATFAHFILGYAVIGLLGLAIYTAGFWAIEFLYMLRG